MIDPDDCLLAKQLNDAGRAIQRSGDLARARRYFRAAALLDSESDLAQYNLATIDLLGSRVNRAERRFRRVLEYSRSPATRADVLVRLGNLAYDRGMLDEAYDLYSQVMDIVIDDTHDDERSRLVGDALCGMGMVEKHRGNLERAKELLDQSVRADPLNMSGYAHLAHCHYKLGNLHAAIQYGQHGITLAEQLPYEGSIAEMWEYLGGYYEDAGMIPEACECYQKAAELGSENAAEILKDLSEERRTGELPPQSTDGG